MAPRTFKLPALSPAQSQFLAHVLVVFLIAFGSQLTAGVTGAVSMPTLLAVLTSAAAAGLTATIHYLTGLVPSPAAAGAYGVSLKLKTKGVQVLVSVVATFLSIFGSALVAGAVHVTSLPSVTDLVIAAISAAVTGAVQFAIGLVPVPTPALTFKLGKLPPVFPVGLQLFRHYLKTPFPAAPPSVAAPQGVDWGMDLNNSLGDCTIAGVDHGIATGNAVFGQTDPRPSLAQIGDVYAQLSPDNTGCAESAVLEKWRSVGLFGNKIKVYAPANHKSGTELRQAIAFLGWCYLGILCPASAQQQAQEQMQSGRVVPWTYEGAPVMGGHCIVAVGYDPGGLWCVSWGMLVYVTNAFVGHYTEEAWCVLGQELAEKGADTLGLDVAALEADLATV